jgi:hypothetical protein
LFFVWYSLQNRFHLSCSVFLRSLFVIELSFCVVLSFSAQSFANQTRLRFFDVMSAWRRFLFRAWISLRLILSQCLMIRALCESSCNLILIFVYKYAKCSSMSCICVSTFKISLDVIRNVSLIVRRFCFWRFINLFVRNKVVSERSCDACHVLLSLMMTDRTTTLYTCLVFLKQIFQIKFVNLINESVCVIILFWIFLTCESHFSLISSCTLNTRTIIVDFRMTFSTLIVISCQMQQLVLSRREASVVSTCSQLADNVSLLQRSAVARDACVVCQNVDIIYEVYDEKLCFIEYDVTIITYVVFF